MIDCWDFIGHSNLLIKCLGCIASVANRCTYGMFLDFLKHGSTGEVKDNGSHREEGGEIGYGQQSSHNGRGWS